ncbi:hypothetical protein [Microbacterium sp. Se5.02b]|uniref:hypothetical protein n=1 Tax=Microbacterium sp. Se5.02b TaxID=2864103 RepID=UPI001C689CF7|nr:hypothetical protein [Microbacterium sp. Se5.02b]QYM62950.1 hypothetical protein K1X59_11320 [Microbacterium sp. Se5.02b]
MSTSHRRLALAAATAAGVLLLSACASGPGSTPAPTSTTVPSDQRLEEAHPGLPDGRVIGVGTVLDVAGDVQLCMGVIMESYPPQCQGVPLDGWTWDGVDGSETSGTTTWGQYAVYASYDGERLTNTDQPIMLALYDTVAPEDPTGGVEGTTAEDELVRVQDDIAARLGSEALTVATDRGYVWLTVVWDDGTMQDAADAEYGDGVVIVTSALRETD